MNWWLKEDEEFSQELENYMSGKPEGAARAQTNDAPLYVAKEEKPGLELEEFMPGKPGKAGHEDDGLVLKVGEEDSGNDLEEYRMEGQGEVDSVDHDLETEQADIFSVEETQYKDCYISYDKKIVFPDVEISSLSVLQQNPLERISLSITNKADFIYSVSFAKMPHWCMFERKSTELTPGETVTLDFHVDKKKLPPGNVKGQGEVVIKRPFIRRAYTIEIEGKVLYGTPIPQVEVKATAAETFKELQIQVMNCGKGLLTGYCYDRSSNEWHTFLLSAQSSRLTDRVYDQGEEDNSVSDSHKVFTLKKQYDNKDEIQSGILIICDCINQFFRNITIDPAHYFPRTVFADKTLIEFLELKPGQQKEQSIHIFHPMFQKKCKVVIPERFQGSLSAEIQQPGNVLLKMVHKGPSQNGSVVEHIHFIGGDGEERKIPVLFSYAEAKE
jgi:hypothetical protein